MMSEDLGVEAKEAAVREVSKLFNLPELLQTITDLKADYIARQQVLMLIFASFYLVTRSFIYVSVLIPCF